MKTSQGKQSKVRLQVYLSHSGLCSRRRAMELVKDGCVAVNGRVVCEPSVKVTPGKDKVCLNGNPVDIKTHTYIMLNKPKGYVTTTQDKYDEKTVLDLLPERLRHLRPVGRLDKNTEGLLLFANNGDVIYRLTHPKFNVNKVYDVRIIGELKPPDIKRLQEGIRIEGKITAPSKITGVRLSGNKTDFRLTIHEGRKRQIRLMLGECGYRVVYLKRISQGPLVLGNLKSGKWRPLSQSEISTLEKL